VRRFALVALLFLPAYANPPKPLAECKNGQCVMSELDYQTLREFHRRVREAAIAIDEQTERLNNEVNNTRAALSRCEGRVDRYRS
jgi:hypothetical protein